MASVLPFIGWAVLPNVSGSRMRRARVGWCLMGFYSSMRRVSSRVSTMALPFERVTPGQCRRRRGSNEIAVAFSSL